jgi:hypothetical protein
MTVGTVDLGPLGAFEQKDSSIAKQPGRRTLWQKGQEAICQRNTTAAERSARMFLGCRYRSTTATTNGANSCVCCCAPSVGLPLLFRVAVAPVFFFRIPLSCDWSIYKRQEQTLQVAGGACFWREAAKEPSVHVKAQKMGAIPWTNRRTVEAPRPGLSLAGGAAILCPSPPSGPERCLRLAHSRLWRRTQTKTTKGPGMPKAIKEKVFSCPPGRCENVLGMGGSGLSVCK